MESVSMKKVGEFLVRKSLIMELMNYIEGRAREGDIKELRNFAPDISLSALIIEERED